MHLAVADEEHKSSTWVNVQIYILKYVTQVNESTWVNEQIYIYIFKICYTSKSKSTAFSILLEWKYKSTFKVLK